MKLLSPTTARHRAALFLLVAGLFGLPPVVGAVSSSSENGARLLRAELPKDVTLLAADCEQLAAAVGKATLAHQPDAPVILRVALTRGIRQLRREEGKLPCACAKRLLSVSVAAAPTQASALLDEATELYPNCAGELASVLRDYDRVSYDYKDRVNDKNVVDDKNGPARGYAGSSDPNAPQRGAADDPAATIQDPGDLTDRDIRGLGLLGDGTGYNGFGSGFGASFPGSPGFIGSTPDGTLALPPTPVTAAVNG